MSFRSEYQKLVDEGSKNPFLPDPMFRMQRMASEQLIESELAYRRAHILAELTSEVNLFDISNLIDMSQFSQNKSLSIYEPVRDSPLLKDIMVECEATDFVAQVQDLLSVPQQIEIASCLLLQVVDSKENEPTAQLSSESTIDVDGKVPEHLAITAQVESENCLSSGDENLRKSYKYHQFNETERSLLAHKIRELQAVGKCTLRALARELHRNHATIKAELKRSSPNAKTLKELLDSYDSLQANNKAKKNREKCHRRGKVDANVLQILGDEIKKHQFSPVQIINTKLKDAGYTISCSTAYRLLGINGVLKEYRQFLRFKGKTHKKGDARLSGRFRDCKGLEQRSEGCINRTEFGHGEMDTIVSGKGMGSACLFTYVDRMTRQVFVYKADACTAENFVKAVKYVISQYPEGAIKSITADRGSEFTNWRDIEKMFNIPCFFCKPHHPWEKGTNENTNGLIREYFPKGTDFSKITQKDVYFRCVRFLNMRPRQILGFKTTYDVFQEECRKYIKNHQEVA